jgi:hypothetical protein
MFSESADLLDSPAYEISPGVHCVLSGFRANASIKMDAGYRIHAIEGGPGRVYRLGYDVGWG